MHNFGLLIITTSRILWLSRLVRLTAFFFFFKQDCFKKSHQFSMLYGLTVNKWQLQLFEKLMTPNCFRRGS